MPSSSEITIYTEHGVKPLLAIDGSGSNGSTSNATYTVVKGWMKGTDKRIAGMQFAVDDNSNNGAGNDEVKTYPPVFNSYYQGATNNGTNTGFSASLTQSWDSTYFQYYAPNMLLFDKVSKAIGNGGSASSDALTYGNIYNYYQANFSISSVKAANAYGNLISVGTDVFTEQTPNDHASLISTNAFDPVNLEDFKVDTVLEEQRNTSASYQKVNQFMVDRWEDGGGLKFMTEKWGTSGVKLVEGYLTQNRDIYSVNKGTATLGQLTYQVDSGYSTYRPTNGNAGGNSEIQFDVGAADTDNNMPGWSGSTAAVLYWHVDTSGLSGTVKDADLVKGKYIFPSTCDVSMNFVNDASALDDRRFTINNMTTSFTASQEGNTSEENEIKYGAKINLTFKVNSNDFIQPFKAEGTNKISSTKSSEFVYLNNVIRSRTDSKKNEGTLFADGDITILGENDKLRVTTSNLTIPDTYALYFNATYVYTSFMFNVITGESTNVSKTVNTKPGRVRNIQDKTVTDVDSGVYVEWENHLATGGYSAITYEFYMQNLKITGETFKPDGTPGALDGGDGAQDTTKELTITINKNETGITNREFEIKDNRYLPGLQNAFQLYVKAKNSAGNSANKTVSDISCLEAAETKETSVVFSMLACQNPIKLADAEGETPSQPVLGNADVYATHLSGTAGNIPSITTDSFGNVLDYETNFFRLNVTAYTSFTNPVEKYIVYGNGRFIGSVAKADMDANSNIILVSKIPHTAYTFTSINNNTDVSFDIIAVSTNDVYSKRTPKTKIIRSLDEAAYPPPVAPAEFTVSNQKTSNGTNYYNKVEIKFNALPNNRINSYKIYQIKVGSDFVVESSSVANYTTGEIDAVNLTNFNDTTVMKVVKSANNVTINGVQTVTIQDGDGGARLYDNQIVAYAVLVYNKDNIAATSVLPTVENPGPSDYTDILYATSQASDATYALSNANCIQQTKTNPPAKMVMSSVSPQSTNYGDFKVQANSPNPRFENYSSDTNLRYSVRYKSTDATYYTSALTGDYNDATTNATWTRTSSNITYTYTSSDLAPNHSFVYEVKAETNMQATTSDPDDWQADTKVTSAYNTKSALYVGKIGSDYESEPSGYGKSNKPGLLYPDELLIERSADALKIRNQEYPLVQYEVSGITYTAPPSCHVGWKWEGASALKSTQIYFAASQPNLTLNEGDILTVYNTNNGATLDSVVVTAGMVTDPSLITFYCSTVQVSAAALSGSSTRFSYTIWRASGKYFEKLNLDSVNKYDKEGALVGAVTDIDNMTALPDGLTVSGSYQDAVFSISPVYYNVYKDGIHIQRVTRTSALPSTGEFTVIDAGDAGSYANYTVTQSYVDSNATNLESNPAYMTAPTKVVNTISSLLADQPAYSLISSAYSTSHVVKAIYADDHDPAEEGLYLNNDTTQTQTLELNNAWSFVSFTTVDVTKTTYEALFDDIFAENANVTRIQIFTQYEALIAKNRDELWSGYIHSNDVGSNKIEYDKAIFVNVQGQATTSFTITGQRVRGMKMSLALGANYVGYPLVSSNQIESKDIFGIDLESGGEGSILWDILYKFQGSKKDDTGVNIVNIDNATALSDYNTGQAFFNTAQGQLMFTEGANVNDKGIPLPNSFSLGTMTTQGLPGDFDGNGLSLNDVSIYGQFLAQKATGYGTINILSATDKKDVDFNKNTESEPTLDIGDAMILLSKVVYDGDNTKNTAFSNTANLSNLTNYRPASYEGPPGSQPSL
jgi:hypothetical protein